MKHSVCVYCGKETDREIIPATGKHTYKDGYCEECGAKDPNYNEPTSESSGKTDESKSENESDLSGDSKSENEESENSGLKKSGCGSNVYGGVALLTVLAAGALIIIKRKKD